MAIIWKNGDYLPTDRVISAADRGFLLGDGVFETILVSDTQPVFFNQHMERLQKGLNALYMPPFEGFEIKPIIHELKTRNGITGNCAMRITMTRGPVGRGLSAIPMAQIKPTVVIALSNGAPSQAQPLKLHLSDVRVFSSAEDRSFKSLSGYGPNIRARYEAAAADCDDALLFNEMGHLVGASAANVFMIEPGRVLKTPPLNDGVLPGITRSVLMQACRKVGWTVHETSILRTQIKNKALALTNCLVGVNGGYAVYAENLKTNQSFLIEAIEELKKILHTAVMEDINREKSAL